MFFMAHGVYSAVLIYSLGLNNMTHRWLRTDDVTCSSDKCWLPNVTLTALVQRELFPKAPMPIPINSREADIKWVLSGVVCCRIFNSN